ncbi:MAG: ABC transporter permease [Burkholderiales bacterium]|nr:ABC transporter permease [Burkholderiales bacterium]
MADNTTISGDQIILPSSITAENSAGLWKQILAREKSKQFTTIDAGSLYFCDESGLALLFRIEHQTAIFKLVNITPEVEQLYKVMTKNLKAGPTQKRKYPGILESVGMWLAKSLHDIKESIAFFGSALCASFYVIFHPREIRPKEIVSVSDTSGTDAVAIVCLIGFLMGVIIAFEIALIAQIFGAVIFVVNGIGIAMTRELGPLMTAILFAGRSGSAFAAQLGTQKVSEELNALTTFGLEPMYFLVIPRLIAASIVVPILSVFAMLAGIIGGGIVMGLYDISFTQFYVQLMKSITVTDICFGLFKAVIFGFVIALIGCECGIHTGAGASAVGESTTKAVVKSIVWIVVIDGVAALLANRLGV